MQIQDILEGYSKAIYSTWFYYKPDHLLFDAGEGVATSLENRVFGIQRVFLSHGHLDHISGIPTILNIRMAGLGDKTKPLEIFYPKDDRYVELLRDHLTRTMYGVSYELEWKPLLPGDQLPLTGTGCHGRYIEVFQTSHSAGRMTLGYNILERRRRLKKEYQGLQGLEIRELIQKEGRNQLEEEYSKKLFSYVGDTVPIDPKMVSDTDFLLHEATFALEEDRKEYVHSSIGEAIRVASESHARALLLYHFSSRYDSSLIFERIRKAAREQHIEGLPIWVILSGRILHVNGIS